MREAHDENRYNNKLENNMLNRYEVENEREGIRKNTIMEIC